MDDSPNDLVAEGDIFLPLLIMSFGVFFPVKFHFSVMWIFFRSFLEMGCCDLGLSFCLWASIDLCEKLIRLR